MLSPSSIFNGSISNVGLSSAEQRTPLSVLRTVFGYRDFRGPQEAIISQVCAGGDALVVMPTGGGKSLCYQIPALLRAGTGVIVSPLIALMEDQVDALRACGVRAEYLNSTLTFPELQRVEREYLSGQIDLLYVAPERLLSERTISLLRRGRIGLFAVDEAHCVSEWGHDFRPEYLQLQSVMSQFEGVPRMALTATADARTQREIISRLGFTSAELFCTSFDRPNIRYEVMLKQNAKAQLLEFLEGRHRGNAGIIYRLSRAKVEETAGWLSEKGYVALPYHAGLPAETRKRNQHRFLREDGVIIVATIAFGMGINKPDVRFVAHLDMPKSMESYYQETGRAGRDGLPSDAWMVYGLGDVVAVREMLNSSEAPQEIKRLEQQRLGAFLGFCETTQCRRQTILRYFGEEHPGGCKNCDCCTSAPESWDGTLAAQKALSAVYRTGERFGASYLASLLVGKSSERSQSMNHEALTIFGVGKELSESEWLSVFRQLVAADLLSVDDSGYGVFRLSERSREVLKGENVVWLRKDIPYQKAKKERGKGRDGSSGKAGSGGAAKSSLSKSSTEISGSGSFDSGLFDSLRAHRMSLAKAQNIPPYVIFHDTTLIEIAERKPYSLDDLREIKGVGEAKLARYGESFLEVVRGYVPG